MARYESKSEEFGQEILQEQIKRQDKVAKEQESFAKKTLAFSTVVEGLNSHLNNRMDTFNTSLADERAFLKTQQGRATTLLNQQKINDDAGISVDEYIRDKLLENRQTQLEKRVVGAKTQTPDSSGKIVETVAINIPKATLAKRDDWTRIVNGEPETTTFDELVKDGATKWKEAIAQARSVPATAAELEKYLATYAKQELPTNVFSFVTRGLSGIFKNETKESLQDKIKKTTAETLKNPLFNSFTNFATKAAGMNNIFPDITQDALASFEKDLKYKNGVLIDTKHGNRIIKDVTTKFDVSSQVVEDAETNQRTTAAVLTPTIVTSYVDGTSVSRVDTDNAQTVTNGSQLITVYNDGFLNIINDDMNQLGQEEWSTYSDSNFKAVSENPMIEWAKFINTGVVDGGKSVNKYLKTDINASTLIEKVLASGGISVGEITAFRQQLKDETKETYRKKQKEWAEATGQLMKDSLEPVMNALQITVDIMNEGTRN
tara:strand:+ start:246 stop:1712 length:1467 start_codon:yes stop_codon:yes gene_type:complete